MYDNLCDCFCPQIQGAIICICMLICIYICVIAFYFVFSAVFIEVGLNLTNLIAFWLYMCLFVYIKLELFNIY